MLANQARRLTRTGRPGRPLVAQLRHQGVAQELELLERDGAAAVAVDCVPHAVHDGGGRAVVHLVAPHEGLQQRALELLPLDRAAPVVVEGVEEAPALVGFAEQHPLELLRLGLLLLGNPAPEALRELLGARMRGALLAAWRVGRHGGPGRRRRGRRGAHGGLPVARALAARPDAGRARGAAAPSASLRARGLLRVRLVRWLQARLGVQAGPPGPRLLPRRC
mmetsp:Transcript_76480/g.206638  ORF Transcript_76480/g.206638 Transcript_76480/m.206638 type:complete len:222 (+) Transcript_76480:149-814(+)